MCKKNRLENNVEIPLQKLCPISNVISHGGYPSHDGCGRLEELGKSLARLGSLYCT